MSSTPIPEEAVLLTLDQVAGMAQLTRRSIERLAAAGDLPTVHIGRAVST